MSESFLAKKILVVTAHPDDESFLSAGTLAKNIQIGGENFLVCGTFGENGKSHLSDKCTQIEFKDRRASELASAAVLLGIKNPIICGYPDGKLVDFIQEFTEDICSAVKNFQPQIILGFGKDGFTGHSDHIATFQAALNIAKEFNLPYFNFVHPPAPWRSECLKVLYGKRKLGQYVDLDPQHAHDVVIAVNPEIKYQALKCHASQFSGLDPYALFTPALAEHFLTHEYFLLKGIGSCLEDFSLP